MRDSAARISEEIAGTEKRQGLDWRTSWSKVVTDSGGRFHVTVSRPEVFNELSLQAGVTVELSRCGQTAKTSAASTITSASAANAHGHRDGAATARGGSSAMSGE